MTGLRSATWPLLALFAWWMALTIARALHARAFELQWVAGVAAAATCAFAIGYLWRSIRLTRRHPPRRF
ncbi:hypothetical protein [Mycobacterium phage Weirdo19]|uniref:Uncharacterized protein n=1 Tax=Mycobacterium phage Weirdo19 TaxID=2601610 RepID=A0A6M2YT96_9CAUD|nr:hypothetical protein KDJ11_gp31 [Mycobacterium phage Weirdo19]QEA10799.1 hypothetical protein [Mycobacterium phage Weirdo19]